MDIYLLLSLLVKRPISLSSTLAQTVIFVKTLQLRGAFGKFLAWSFISVTDLQNLSCLVSF